MKLLFRLFVLLIYLVSTWALYADVQIRSSINKDSDASIAYNSVDDEYLIVWTEYSASGIYVMGQLTKGDGTGNIGAAFTIFSIGAFPSVAYNAQTNEYMVTESLSGNIIGRRVSNTGTLIGSPVTYISKTNSIYSEIVYNSLGNNYLLIAGELFDLGNDQANIKIYARKITANGQPTGTEQLIRDQGHGNYSDGARFSIAYAPIISPETPTGRCLLAIDSGGKFDLTMLDHNGVIVSRLYDSGIFVDNYVAFEFSKVGIAYNVDVAFGNFEGEETFMVVWGDRNNQYNSQPWSGIWAGIVNAGTLEYDVHGVSNTVFPVSAIPDHNISPEYSTTWKPAVAYNEVAYKFMIAWRETPTTDPRNDTKVNHIRANAVTSSIPNYTSNVVVSAITGNENPKNPAIATSTNNSNAFVVWDDERNISTKDVDLYGNLFTTTASKTLILTSPNGNEEWVEGTQHSITWESSGIGSSDVNIEYSIDNGVSFNFIAFQTNADGNNTYSWTVPNTPSTQCLVQISVGGISDQTDATFIIKKTPKITIISPNGGEVWLAGSQQEIKWESVNIGNFDVTIEYSNDNGANYQFVTFFTNVDGLNSFNWEVPNTASNQCLVRVSLSAVSDISDALFTIVVPQITVVSPNGGENWIDGEQREIKWTSVGFSGNVRIDLLYHGTNDSGYFNVAINEINDGSFNWNLDISQLPIQSNQQGFNCLVRVSDATKNPPGVGPNDGKLFDWSGSYFTFQDNLPRITVISPNGGEVWNIGEQREIKWTSSNYTDPVNIVLTTFNQIAISGSIAQNIPNTGSYIWTVNTGINDTVLATIRVEEHGPPKPNIFDESDAFFTIIDTTTKITVISPNGGEVWDVGSQHEIKWIGTNSTDSVYISHKFGALPFPWIWAYGPIKAIPNNGSYIWTVEDVFKGFPEWTHYVSCKVTITDLNNYNNRDESDFEFKIVRQINSFIGDSVNVDLGDGAQITFDNVSSSGATTLNLTQTGAPPPNSYTVFGSPNYYNIETTAEFTGNLKICINYDDTGLDPYEEAALRLYVNDTTLAHWVDITTSLDKANNIICGEVSHLSEFAIMMPASDPLVFTVTNTNDIGEGSFRKAIDGANTNTSADKIMFNIPKSDPNYDAAKGVWNIRPVTYYNSILDSGTVIDGTSQRIYIGEDTNPEGPEIVFSGSSMTTNNGFLNILANNIEVYELTINNFNSTAIRISNSQNNIISGCYIGTDYTGMKSEGNRGGIEMGPNVNGTLIGSSIFLEKANVISGNDQNGIFIVDNSINNGIIGNFIGVNKNATDTITNKLRGIDLSRGADHNSIMENIVGGNYQGIYLYEANNNLIRANKIGTNETWEYDLFNSDGILVFNNSSENIIRENIIGYNRGWGIKISGSGSVRNKISWNSISQNLGFGIDNSDGGNTEIAPPIITSILNNQITGTAGPNQIIEIFADSSYEGKIFIDSTITDLSGNFLIPISNFPNLPNITATARDILDNTSEFSTPFIVTDIKVEDNNLPTSFALYQNYPNPFNPSTVISWQMPIGSYTTLKVYDVLGNEIKSLINKQLPAGNYEITFDAKNLSSGVYFYQLKSESFTKTQKMLYLE